jgi:hypothetical protein
MAAVRWFRVPVRVGLWQQDLYLYQTLMNLFDFQYHWMYTSRLHRGLAEAIQEFRDEFTRHHLLTLRGLELVVGTPVEVSWTAVEAARPRNQSGAYLDPH